jgi:hypothetical protein
MLSISFLHVQFQSPLYGYVREIWKKSFRVYLDSRQVNLKASPALKYQNCILNIIFCFHFSILHPAQNEEKCQNEIIFIFFGLSGTVPRYLTCSLTFHRWSKLAPRFSSRSLVSPHFSFLTQLYRPYPASPETKIWFLWFPLNRFIFHTTFHHFFEIRLWEVPVSF